ncbi:MAG: VOC family protein [Pseudomonadota bacterium]
MIGYVSFGADDLDAAKRFYLSFLPALGYSFEEGADGLSFRLDDGGAGPEFYVDTPFDGKAASNGNGSMIGFAASCQADVRRLHAAALAAGGTDEGAPGFRAAYSAGFYVGYLRDPQGNKLSIYSDNPDEPGRDD